MTNNKTKTSKKESKPNAWIEHNKQRKTSFSDPNSRLDYYSVQLPLAQRSIIPLPNPGTGIDVRKDKDAMKCYANLAKLQVNHAKKK